MMKNVLRISGSLIFGLNVLLLFFLVFEAQLVFPVWMQAVGRMHPLLLHLPIGLVFVSFALNLVQTKLLNHDYHRIILVTLHASALLAAATALMGLILSAEGGYDPDALATHRVSGSILSLLTGISVLLLERMPNRPMIVNGALGVSVVLLVVAGHYGAVLTHGENFLLAPLTSNDNNQVIITDSTTFYEAAIQPVWERKCTGCHNSSKSKGGLVLTSLASATRGGEHGALWTALQPNRSLIMKRVLLPETHKEHMPPAGKPQLSVLEAQLIYEWIRRGADTLTTLNSLSGEDSLRVLAGQVSGYGLTDKTLYAFDFADPAIVSQLNDPFLTVSPLAANEPALSANFFISKEFSRSKLDRLLDIKEQLVTLSLARMPVAKEECELIGRFVNLEKLDLNFTAVDGAALKSITKLEKLKVLSLAGTSVDQASLMQLNEMASLKEVFLWNTPAMNSIEDLKSAMPRVAWNTGYVPSESEVLRLTPPMLVKEIAVLGPNDRVAMTHKLPGTVIRYTTDGTEPDSINSQVYDQPVAVNEYTVLKASACKDGWYCSDPSTFTFFPAGIHPDSAVLLTKPDKDYRGSGALTLIDQDKGYADNHRDKTWLGFRGAPVISTFHFSGKPAISRVTISFLKNTGSFLFPPLRVEVWAGTNEKNMKLVAEGRPAQPGSNGPSVIEALTLPVAPQGYALYKVVIHPVPELPKWHPSNKKKTKDKRAWVFVDEVFFNE